MFNQSAFKETDSSLTPEPDKVTTHAIHLAGTARFIAKLVEAGLTFHPENSFEEADLPVWSVMPARRWQSNLDAGLISRGMIIRLDDEPISIAVFASSKGTVTSALERAVGRIALAEHVYCAVIADRGLETAPRYAERVQAALAPDAAEFGGLRSDIEIVNFIKSRL